MNQARSKKQSKKLKKSKTNYSQIYKQNLLNFVNKDKSIKGQNLSKLVELKLEELSTETDPEKQNYYAILALSLYFIKDNEFIQDKEEYFNQIEDSIYKIFNKFLMNPTEQQHKEFLKSFENLNYGFSNIYMVCKKLIGINPMFRDIPINREY